MAALKGQANGSFELKFQKLRKKFEGKHRPFRTSYKNSMPMGAFCKICRRPVT